LHEKPKQKLQKILTMRLVLIRGKHHSDGHHVDVSVPENQPNAPLLRRRVLGVLGVA
jgi:hypothetical protein